MQELDDQALEVLKAAKATEELLSAKSESLTVIRSEFERKQKEVCTSTSDIILPTMLVFKEVGASCYCSISCPN